MATLGDRARHLRSELKKLEKKLTGRGRKKKKAAGRGKPRRRADGRFAKR